MCNTKDTIVELLEKYSFEIHQGSDLVQEQLLPEIDIDQYFFLNIRNVKDGVYTHVFLARKTGDTSDYRIYVAKANIGNVVSYAKEIFVEMENKKMSLNSLEDAMLKKDDDTVPVFIVDIPPFKEVVKKTIHDLVSGFMNIVKR